MPEGIKPPRLLFYDDVAIFGGHEVMALNALEHLLSTGEYRIMFVYSSRNARLESKLKELQERYPDLELVGQSYTTGKLQFLRTFYAVRPLQHLRALARNYAPDCAIVIQGDISNSSLGLVAAVREAIYTISYIPLAHTRNQRGERFARTKDLILQWYYGLPHHFITISKSMKSMLQARGARQPIDIVENGIDVSAFDSAAKVKAREKLGVAPDDYVAALCGRIEFKQKGQDLLLRSLEGRTNAFRDWIFLIVGDGPDGNLLKAMTEAAGLSQNIRFFPWQQDMSLIYSAANMVVLPSRFEGVPVVMLEAMYCGLPIVASACDAMAEILPGEWLFPIGDNRMLGDALLRVRSLDNKPWLIANKQLVSGHFTLERQKLEFACAIRQCVNGIHK